MRATRRDPSPARRRPTRSSRRCAASSSGPGSPACRRPYRPRAPNRRARPAPVAPHRVPGIPGPRGTRALLRDDAAWAAVAGYPPRLRRISSGSAAAARVRGVGVGRGGTRAPRRRRRVVARRGPVDQDADGRRRRAGERRAAAAGRRPRRDRHRRSPRRRGRGHGVGGRPGPGARLLRGSTVALTVSSGRPQVPAVAAGTAVPDAETAIRDTDLTPPARAARGVQRVGPGGHRRPHGSARRHRSARWRPRVTMGRRIKSEVSKGAERPRRGPGPLLVGRTAGGGGGGGGAGGGAGGGGGPSPRSISATRNASSRVCWVFSRGSHAVS